MCVWHDQFTDLRAISEDFHAFVLLLRDGCHLWITYFITFWIGSSFTGFLGKIKLLTRDDLLCCLSIFVVTIAHKYVLPGSSFFICMSCGAFRVLRTIKIHTGASSEIWGTTVGLYGFDTFDLTFGVHRLNLYRLKLFGRHLTRDSHSLPDWRFLAQFLCFLISFHLFFMCFELSQGSFFSCGSLRNLLLEFLRIQRTLTLLSNNLHGSPTSGSTLWSRFFLMNIFQSSQTLFDA